MTQRPLCYALLCLLAALASLVWLDLPLARMTLRLDGSDLGIARVLSAVGNSAWVLVPAGLFLLLRAAGRLQTVSAQWATRLREVFWMVIATGLLADLLKGVVARPRPRVWLREGMLEPRFFHWFDAAWASMPSGHTVTAFTLAWLLARLSPRLAVPAFVVATGVALSRVALGAHYLSDTLMGAGLVFLFFGLGRYLPQGATVSQRAPSGRLSGKGSAAWGLRSSVAARSDAVRRPQVA